MLKQKVLTAFQWNLCDAEFLLMFSKSLSAEKLSANVTFILMSYSEFVCKEKTKPLLCFWIFVNMIFNLRPENITLGFVPVVTHHFSFHFMFRVDPLCKNLARHGQA